MLLILISVTSFGLYFDFSAYFPASFHSFPTAQLVIV